MDKLSKELIYSVNNNEIDKLNELFNSNPDTNLLNICNKSNENSKIKLNFKHFLLFTFMFKFAYLNIF